MTSSLIVTKRDPTLLVLAAGMGSRYGGLKQIVPVNQAGDAIVDYSVYDAVRAGFGRVVFVIRRDIEDVFKAGVGAKFERHVDVAYAFQELRSLTDGMAISPARTKPWGTLHATLVGAEHIDGAFAVINADDFYGAESYCALSRHLKSDSEHSAMVGFPLRNTLSEFGPVSRGVCEVSADGLLMHTVERTKIVREGNGARVLGDDSGDAHLSGDEIASMNMWGFHPSILPNFRAHFREFLQTHAEDLKAESYLPEAVNHAVSNGEANVEVLRTRDEWCGITYPEDYDAVVRAIAALTRAGSYPERLWP